MEILKRVYFFPQNPDGSETGEAIPVELKPDGNVDLSKLPEDMRSFLESCALPDEVHEGFLSPKDGKRYLMTLLRSSNQTMHFRSTSTTHEPYEPIRNKSR
jgi:hypothetical protein